MPKFRTDIEKWRWLRAAPAHDQTEPEVRQIAYALRTAADGDPWRFCVLAHAYVRDAIRYQTDTARVGGEDITRRLAPTLDRGVDDCDAKARLFCALCLCVGLRARMVDRWAGDTLEHVSAAVKFGGQEWPVETILARARLGETAEDVPTEADGTWLK